MAADMKNSMRKRICIFLMPTANPTHEGKHIIASLILPDRGQTMSPATLPKYIKVQTYA